MASATLPAHVLFDISEISPNFPDFRVAALVAVEIEVRATRSPALAAFVAECERETRERFGGMELSAIPGVAAWRHAWRVIEKRRDEILRADRSATEED